MSSFSSENSDKGADKGAQDGGQKENQVNGATAVHMTGIQRGIMEISDLLRVIAEPLQGERVKQLIERAAQRVSVELRARDLPDIQYDRTRRLWHGEARRIDGHEADAIRAAATRRITNTDINDDIQKAISAFAVLREALTDVDASLFRKEITQLGDAIGSLGLHTRARRSNDQ